MLVVNSRSVQVSILKRLSVIVLLVKKSVDYYRPTRVDHVQQLVKVHVEQHHPRKIRKTAKSNH